MRGREANKGATSTDLLVCFPSRAHLALVPKPICSPARPSEPNNRHRHHHHHHHYHHHHRRHSHSHLRRLTAGHASSPLLWSKTNSKQEIDEPTSPKVTCAGQIKVRPRPSGSAGGSCKSWQSVMEEIERIHKSRKNRTAFGFKKDVLNFLTCLRNIRLDFRCFGSFPNSDITSDDDEDEEENEDEENGGGGEEEQEESSRTVFSKWFMVLQENQNNSNDTNNETSRGFSEKRERNQRSYDFDRILDVNGDSVLEPAVPPPNALLLMRCRSAPAKRCLEEQERDEIKREDDEEDGGKKKKKDLRSLIEEEKMITRQKENVVVMRYDADFYKLSADIAKETWVVGGIKDPFSRSRSWKR